MAAVCSPDPVEVGYRDSDEIFQVTAQMRIIILTQGIRARRELQTNAGRIYTVKSHLGVEGWLLI